MEIDADRLRAIDEMRDRQAIHDCLLRYTRGIDRHDSGMVASAYHPGALDDHTDYIGPGEHFADYANGIHRESFSAHQHYITNTTIDLDGDTAHVETYWIMAGRHRDASGTSVHGGRYVDRFEKRNGKWAIAARICVYEWGLDPEQAALCLDAFPLGTQGKDDVSYLRPLEVQRPRTA